MVYEYTQERGIDSIHFHIVDLNFFRCFDNFMRIIIWAHWKLFDFNLIFFSLSTIIRVKFDQIKRMRKHVCEQISMFHPCFTFYHFGNFWKNKTFWNEKILYKYKHIKTKFDSKQGFYFWFHFLEGQMKKIFIDFLFLRLI